jgi:hypothetical protein
MFPITLPFSSSSWASVMAEPAVTTADFAIKLSAALPILERHEFLGEDDGDDIGEQLGWMDRIAARLLTDACKLVGVPLTGLIAPDRLTA